MSIIKALLTIEQIKKDYPDLELIKFNCKPRIFCEGTNYFTKFSYHVKYDSISFLEDAPDYGDDFRFYRYHEGIVSFFIKHKIHKITFNKIALVKHYNKKELALLIILKYWKRYRYNLYKKRRDPLKRELMEYVYHPSRIIFET
jgi:hypothetical protein